MKKQIRSAIGKAALKILPDSNKLRYIAHRPKIETWLRLHERDAYPVLKCKTDMYGYVNRDILQNKAVLYLEFGVYQGKTIKSFSEINTHSDSRFVGFDTFTGLPEQWEVNPSQTVKRSAFDADGKLPVCDDTRVTFVKGLFQESLPLFRRKLEPKCQVVIHNDSDLYSSSLYVLTFLNDVILPGTIIMFDEFVCVMHEFRALEDYCASYMREYVVVAATTGHHQVAVRML